MCDFSIEASKSRAAVVGDELVSGHIRTDRGFTMSRGFYADSDPGCAVCLRAGTEIAFEKSVMYYSEKSSPAFWGSWGKTTNTKFKTAIFRQVNLGQPYMHHDLLQFPDGSGVFVSQLAPGQCARVLQLPAVPVDEPEVLNASLRKEAKKILAEIMGDSITPF